jgi:hypothetical protein
MALPMASFLVKMTVKMIPEGRSTRP